VQPELGQDVLPREQRANVEDFDGTTGTQCGLTQCNVADRLSLQPRGRTLWLGRFYLSHETKQLSTPAQRSCCQTCGFSRRGFSFGTHGERWRLATAKPALDHRHAAAEDEIVTLLYDKAHTRPNHATAAPEEAGRTAIGRPPVAKDCRAGCLSSADPCHRQLLQRLPQRWLVQSVDGEKQLDAGDRWWWHARTP
jgi:hypothetical protein